MTEFDLEDKHCNRSDDNNDDVVALPENVPLKAVVDQLQAEVKRMVASHNSRIVELETEVKHLVAKQVVLEEKLSSFVANQNRSNGTEENNSTTISSSNDKSKDVSNQNNETTDSLSSETTGQELEFNRSIDAEKTTETTHDELDDEELIAALQRIGSQSTEGLIQRVDEEEITFSPSTEITSKNNHTIVKTLDFPECDHRGSCVHGESDQDVKIFLFQDSSHRYLFMDTIEEGDHLVYKVQRHHRLLALSIVLLQLCAYYFIGYLIIFNNVTGKKEQLQSGLEIDASFCYDANGHFWGEDRDMNFDNLYTDNYKAALYGNVYKNLAEASITAEDLPEMLQCSDPTSKFHHVNEKGSKVSLILIGSILLTCFLLPDLFESFILMKCLCWRDRMVGALLFSKSIAASVVGALGCSDFQTTGLLDSFMLYVGVIFIHEIDEQFGYLLHIIEHTKEKHFRRQFVWVFFFAYLPMVLLIYFPFVIFVLPKINDHFVYNI